MLTAAMGSWEIHRLRLTLIGSSSMRSPIFLCLLFTAACSAPSHRTYSQGIPGPAFPAPSMAPVGTGAPVVGQPGQRPQQHQPPRSPYTRPLPPSREPGLWAAEAPRAARAGGYSPSVLGVPVPVASDESLEDMFPTTECASSMDKAARRVVTKEALTRIPPKVLQCLVARLVHRCTSSHMQSLEAGRLAVEDFDAEKFRRWRAAHAAAEAFKADSCEGLSVDPAMEKGIIHAWQADLWRGED